MQWSVSQGVEVQKAVCPSSKRTATEPLAADLWDIIGVANSLSLGLVVERSAVLGHRLVVVDDRSRVAEDPGLVHVEEPSVGEQSLT